MVFIVCSPEPLGSPHKVTSYWQALSSVCGYVCMSTFSNILSSETTGPIEAKFHMEPPWDGGTKICSNGPGHMTKMAAMPIYGKNLEKSSLEPKRLCP